MHKRTAHRWRLAVVFVVGGAFALGSFWLLQVMHTNVGDGRVDQRANEPDYIVEHFSVVRMTPSGQPRYIVSGTKLTHRPVDDSADIEQPVIQSLSTDQPPMTMRAKSGRVDHANSQVHLLGDVDIERAASPTAQALSLKTPYLTVFPDDDQMQTDQPVNMMLGSTIIDGVGMHANNATRQIHIGGRGQLVTPPRPQP